MELCFFLTPANIHRSSYIYILNGELQSEVCLQQLKQDQPSPNSWGNMATSVTGSNSLFISSSLCSPVTKSTRSWSGLQDMTSNPALTLPTHSTCGSCNSGRYEIYEFNPININGLPHLPQCKHMWGVWKSN